MTHINLLLSFNQKYATALINSTVMIYIINVMVGAEDRRGKMKAIKSNFKSSEQKKNILIGLKRKFPLLL